MTSLSEVYEAKGRSEANLRRLYLGVGLFGVGSLLAVAGMVVGTTDLLLGGDWTVAQVRELGVILAGLGVPAVFLGISAVFPAEKRTRAATVIGAFVALLGVGLFWYAYPCQWTGSNCAAGRPILTLPTLGVYFLGTITTFWGLFVGVATFKTRNDPGGTVTMEVTRQGETRIVEVDRGLGGLGGVGLFGSDPDGEVATQTNRSDGTGSGSTGGPGSAGSAGGRSTGGSRSRSAAGRGSAHLSDGGSTTGDVRSPGGGRSGTGGAGRTATGTGGAEVVTDEGPAPGDDYCGNCAHFEYVRTDQGIQPYCGFHDELMDDMTACQEWTSRQS